MEYNLPSELVKDLAFGGEAKDKIISGVNKLARAVKSTLGASGRCVVYEDGRGKPVITWYYNRYSTSRSLNQTNRRCDRRWSYNQRN